MTINRPLVFVYLLHFALFLFACAGTKERETERILLLHKLYSGSIIRVDMRKENGWVIDGTAFYTGKSTGFITARHVLMHEDQEGVEYPAEHIMLHIPSCKTGFAANMGDHSEDDITAYLNDWANFIPDTDILTRRPLIYDPQYPLHNGQQVFIAGYPSLNRDYDYVGDFPDELLAARSFFVYATTHHFGTASQTGSQKFSVVKIAGALYNDQAGQGMSGGPVLVWDSTIQDFIVVGILVQTARSLQAKIPLLYFIRPHIPIQKADP